MSEHPVLDNLAVAAQALESAALFLADEANADDVALCLYDMASVKRLAGRVYADMERHYLSLCSDPSDRKREVLGVGLVEVRKRTKRTGWRMDELIPVVVARALDERKADEETGEIEREAVAVARAMRECLSISTGKVTGLRARGIQPDEFCLEEPDGYSVVLPAPPETALSDGEAA